VPRLDAPLRWEDPSAATAWEQVPPLPVVQSAPLFGAPPSERTVLRLAHDDEYLYAAGWMYDSDPGGIRAVSLRRDESSFSSDWFLVSLDTFRDLQNTLLFATTPTGLRTDVAFSNDATPPPNIAWNTFWDVAVTRDGHGWYAVMRIPFSSLRFEQRDGVVVMGVTLARRIARRNEMISWPAIPHDWGTNSIYKASLMNEIVLRGLTPATPVYATPYFLLGETLAHQADPSGERFVRHGTVRHEPGLDLKYSPATNLTVDVTVNPDFAQVEADEQRVNLTRFSLFFPERRPFFQERASVFEYSLGGNERVFHSRRIGLVDGAPVRIWGGARLVTHASGWDVGLLSMQTDGGSGASSENAGVVRARRRILNDHSTAGAIATTRLGKGGTRHLTWGGDALLRLSARDYVTLNWAESLNAGDEPSTRAERGFGRVRWERRGNFGFGHDVSVARVGERFAPALGFVERNDYWRGEAQLSRGWRARPASRVLGYFATVEASAHRRLAGGIESASVNPAWQVDTKSGHTLTAGAVHRLEDLDRPFRVGPDALVPAGAHRFTQAQVRYGPSRTWAMQVPLSAAVGGFYDGRGVSVSATPGWDASAHFRLSGAWQWNRIGFADREERFESHLLRLRTLVMLDTRISAIAFVQYSTAEDVVGVNLRIRYNPREGDDLYLVYDHSLRMDRRKPDPVPPLTDRRALLLKYSRTFPVVFRRGGDRRRRSTSGGNADALRTAA
jgi:hypothetical protein